jgi:hypothetical protein
MSSTEERSGVTSPPPPPADGDGSRAVLAILIVLLIVALAVTGVLAMNVFGPGSGPSPTPTQVAAPSPSPAAATDLQTPTPDAPDAASPSPPTTTASPDPVAGTPTVTPYDPQQALLGHIPADLRDSCQLAPGTAPALATATCQADDGQILATYFLYDSEQAMDNAYDDFVETSTVERDSGRCSEPETWPSEGAYSISEQPAGRVLCMQISDAPTIYWTDSRLLVLSSAFHLGADAERLYEFWLREAGPSL